MQVKCAEPEGRAVPRIKLGWKYLDPSKKAIFKEDYAHATEKQPGSFARLLCFM